LFTHAVVDAFRDRHSPDLKGRFATFTEAEWVEGLAWLDSQDTLDHFLQRIQELGLDQAIPLSAMLRMKERFANNELRLGEMFDAFMRVNDCLLEARIKFCNVQGFALIPTLRADPRLRSFPALELLVQDADMELCWKSLSTLGYTGRETGRHVYEFDFGATIDDASMSTTSLVGQIRIRVHSVGSTEEREGRTAYHMLMRSRPQMWKGYVFNAPAASEQFVVRAMMIENQIEKGRVLLADLLEFSHCFRFWSRSDEFWDEVVERSLEDSELTKAVGVAAIATSKLFGNEMPLALWQFAKETPNELLIPMLERFGCGELENESWRPVQAEARPRRRIGYPAKRVRAEEADDTRLLERICAAYSKTIEEAPRHARQYGPSPWWKSVERKELSEVQRVLQARNILELRVMYENFFRAACGTGLVRRPVKIEDAHNQRDPDDARLCAIREDTFYRVGYWRIQTGGQLQVSALRSPDVGNPFGVTIDGTLIAAGAESHHACAHCIVQMAGAGATVVEIGGGFGNMAYYLLKAGTSIKYVDFDVPESLALTAYFLGRSAPHLAMVLYGEKEFAPGPKTAYEVALMPPWMMERLPDNGVDVTFSSHVLRDLTPSAQQKYLEEIARFTSGVLIDISNEKDESAESFERLFTCVARRPSYWNLYRAPDAKEWEKVLRPLRQPRLAEPCTQVSTDQLL
jgi:putative sugar O-methyltransferase